MPSKLGYWDVRGIANPIRLLLEYVGEDYEDIFYKDTYDKENWLQWKYSLGLPFPQLPYYIDGDIKLTQSRAIMRHLARKYQLEPDEELDRATLDMIGEILLEIFEVFVDVLYRGKDHYEKNRHIFLETLKPRVQSIDTFLANKDWLAGSKISSVDFLLFDSIETFAAFSPTYLSQFHNLWNFRSNFMQLPRVADYLKSERYAKLPVFSSRTQWQGFPDQRHNNS